jgi:hypothetical protein
MSTIDMFIHPQIQVGPAGQRGRGVFAMSSLPIGTCIETSPVIVLSSAERLMVEKTLLYDYIFAWGPSEEEAAVALGYISLYNHTSPSNCEYEMDFEKKLISITTMRDIAAGEELTINYAADWHLKKPVWFDAV